MVGSRVDKGLSALVGSELNRTRGKRGGIPGDIGASSFPSSFCVASVSGSIFARSLTLIPRSLHWNRTERLASQSPIVFFPRQFFARALQSERLEQAPGSLVSYLCQDPAPASASLFVFVVVVFYFCWCLLSHFTFHVFLLCVLLLYVLHWNPNKLFHFPCVKVLCQFFPFKLR